MQCCDSEAFQELEWRKPKTRFSAQRTTLIPRPALRLEYCEPKVSSVDFPQFLGDNHRTASTGAGANEPAREGHRLKAGGPAILVMVEEKRLHRLSLVVQIHYVPFLKLQRGLPLDLRAEETKLRLLQSQVDRIPPALLKSLCVLA